jgi:hypothetical protein
VPVVQIWIMHINALKTQLMYKNVQTNPEKFQNLTQHSCCSMLYTREKIEMKKRQQISFRPERWNVPYGKPSCLLWIAPVYEKHIPKPAPNGTNLYHGMLMLLHDCMPSFMNFRRVLELLEFKNQASQCFAGNQRCPGVWNSFPFLAWALCMHQRTHIWFFNQFICNGACACSSNLNYTHKMHWKLS